MMAFDVSDQGDREDSLEDLNFMHLGASCTVHVESCMQP